MPTPEEKRRLLWSLLGDLPDSARPTSVERVRETQCEHYVLEELLLDLNGTDPAPAYFVRPLQAPGPTPAVLYHHAHGGDYLLGKEELIRGRKCLQNPPYAEALARRGWSVLAVDAWNFGGRHRSTESAVFKEMLWRGRVLWGMMVYDAVRSLDYLASRPDVLPGRIVTLGMSMGSTLSWWLAALDERTAGCAEIGCLTDFDALIEDGGLDRHGLYYYVPALLKHFTAGDINALIAPRPHLSLIGTQDGLTPEAGVARIDEQLRSVYAAHDARDAWKLVRCDCGHQETPEMRGEILKWLDQRNQAE